MLVRDTHQLAGKLPQQDCKQQAATRQLLAQAAGRDASFRCCLCKTHDWHQQAARLRAATAKALVVSQQTCKPPPCSSWDPHPA